MINTINLKNFKLHKDTTIDFGKINVFIGPNNSGKSSVIHAMELLAKISTFGANPPPVSQNPFYIDVAEFGDIVSKGEYFLEIGIEGEVPLSAILSPSESETAKKFIASENIKITIKYCLEKDKVFIKDYKLKLKFLGVDVEEIPEEIPINVDESDYITSYEIHFLPLPPGGTKEIITEEIIIEDKTRIMISSFEGILVEGKIKKENKRVLVTVVKGDTTDILFSILKKIIEDSPQKLIDSFHFVYPIRGFEWQAYDIEQTRKSSNLNLDNISLEGRAKSIPNAFHYDANLKNEIYEAMKDVIDVKFFTEPLSREKVKLLSEISKKRNIPFLFEGLGSHQMLFMFLPIALAKQGDTICIEEPENHLHPKAQYELAKLFVNIVKKEEKQLVITTHSEHIIYGFLNSVANGKLKKNELRIYYFKEPVETIPDVKEARVEKLNINEFGQVEGGLPGFFETKRKELSEFLNPPDKNK